MVFEKLKEIKTKYNLLEKNLLKASLNNNFEEIKEISKEKALLEDIVIEYNKYLEITNNIKEIKELLKDETLKEMVLNEIDKFNKEKEETEKRLEIMLIPKDENDEKNILLEIRGAAGGSEANIFAGDLLEMYLKYITKKGWSYEIINSVFSETGGYSQVELLVKGKNVYSKLKYESGSHRVQRVPVTESQGRVHTSTATVIVRPEQKDIEIEINEADLKIDVYKSSGAGGQSVNTTDSAVRITHLPTNMVVTCQNERSQIKNREKAYQLLKNKIYEHELAKQAEKTDQERKMKIGTGDRSEKIRTYNYPQNRVTDHRINYTIIHLDRIMEGELDELIEVLIKEDIKRKLTSNEL